MKRMSRTLTAAALSGALALGGTAVATAQIPAPAVFTLDGVTYQKQADGSYKSTNELGSTSLTADQAQAAWERLQEQNASNEAPAAEVVEGPTTTIQLAPDADQPAPAPAPAPAGPSKVDTPIDNGTANSASASASASAPASEKPTEKPSESAETPASSAKVEPSSESAAPSSQNAEPGSSDVDAKKLAWLALPAALVIGGVTWYLAQDGKTYVKSQAAAQNAEPSAEEKAASEQMLEANKDEVIAQGGKIADSTAEKAEVESRGMSAETGSNTVARGVAALAIAAMIAGAFAARRKFFI